MKTPIIDFLRDYADKDAVRLHMPGHKGKPCGNFLDGVLPYDITEIGGADSLFEADGIIRESEENASRLFGTARTLFSAGGSTLGIQTMLALAAKPGETVIAARNAHKAFLGTCALLDLNAEWIYPEQSGEQNIVSYRYTAEDIERTILRAEKPACVYITSPDYYGRTADISGISTLCKKHGIPLLVDNAHGAHLAFLEESMHPIALGADMCCDSAHKMLPALTGAAYLHIGNPKYADRAKDVMAMFASTSPSYLIMASLDWCNGWLDGVGTEEIRSAAEKVSELKESLKNIYTIMESEPLRITIFANPCGLTGTGLAEQLRIQGIECEYADFGYVVLLFSPKSAYEDFRRVKEAMERIRMPRIMLPTEEIALPRPEKVMSIREAVFSENEEIPVEEAEGRICGIAKVTCPPGIAIAVSGERIDKFCIDILKKYSILRINVVK